MLFYYLLWIFYCAKFMTENWHDDYKRILYFFLLRIFQICLDSQLYAFYHQNRSLMPCKVTILRTQKDCIQLNFLIFHSDVPLLSKCTTINDFFFRILQEEYKNASKFNSISRHNYCVVFVIPFIIKKYTNRQLFLLTKCMKKNLLVIAY